jgi:hypothetical protein
VSWISTSLVRLDRYRFDTDRPLSLSIVDFTQTTQLPSGEIWYAPADSVNRMSSKVHSPPASS